jgi:hypothetical protein
MTLDYIPNHYVDYYATVDNSISMGGETSQDFDAGRYCYSATRWRDITASHTPAAYDVLFVIRERSKTVTHYHYCRGLLVLKHNSLEFSVNEGETEFCREGPCRQQGCASMIANHQGKKQTKLS